MTAFMWEERVQMGPPPTPPGATAQGLGTSVPLAGWTTQKTGRYLTAALFVVGGFGLAALLWVVSAVFSVWGSGPTTTDTLVQLGCIAAGCAMAAAIVWPVLGERGPELVLDEHFLRLHHPDLVADMLIERSNILAIHADHALGHPGLAFQMGLSPFDGSNLEMVFITPQRIPRARFISQISPLFSMRTGRAVPGLRLRVTDVTWARQVFGTMPQYRSLTGDDYQAAGLDLTRKTMSPRAVGVMILAACLLVMAKNWFLS